MLHQLCGSFQWRGKHYQIIFQTLLNKWLAVYVISITIVLFMIVIGGLISRILCWFPWYYVNANKCIERRRSAHFIQFRGSLHTLYSGIWHNKRTSCTTCTTLTDFFYVNLQLVQSIGCVIWCLVHDLRCLWCQDVADNQMFQYRLNANILWPVFQWNIWNFVEILESGENLMPHTQTVTLCYLNSWPGPWTRNINSENLNLNTKMSDFVSFDWMNFNISLE